MRQSKRFLIGGLVVLVVLVTIAVIAMTRGGDSNSALPAGNQAVTLNCIGGDEKAALMADEQVKRILRDRYGVAVNYQTMGSYDQVQLTTDVLKQRATACLWPASASAQAVFEAQHKDAFGGYRAETVLQSPEVIYAGPQSAEALVRAGIAHPDGSHFVVDMKSLVDRILHGQTWESLRAGNLAGPIAVSSTDPTKSNSGFVLYQLMLNIASTSNVYQAPSVQQAHTALPALRQAYDAQGLLSRGSGAGFRQWRLQGGESHAPLYAGYENQLIEAWLDSTPADRKDLLDRVRVLYPEPTLYSDHPILALTADGSRLIEAMKDPEIQKIAWANYGFRSGVDPSINNVADFPELQLAPEFRTATPPNAEVTLLLLGCLRKAEACT